MIYGRKIRFWLLYIYNATLLTACPSPSNSRLGFLPLSLIPPLACPFLFLVFCFLAPLLPLLLFAQPTLGQSIEGALKQVPTSPAAGFRARARPRNNTAKKPLFFPPAPRNFVSPCVTCQKYGRPFFVLQKNRANFQANFFFKRTFREKIEPLSNHIKCERFPDVETCFLISCLRNFRTQLTPVHIPLHRLVFYRNQSIILKINFKCENLLVSKFVEC